MYQYKYQALLHTVGEQAAVITAKRKLRKGELNLMARIAVKRTGITHDPDVQRIARKICTDLGEHGRNVQAVERADRALMQKIAS